MYAPPKALVSDPLDDRSDRRKPRAVHRAAMMLWASLAIGVLNLLFQPGLETSRYGWIGWSIVAATFGFFILLTMSISAGHNWARITFLVLFNLFQQLLQVSAMFLVFTRPGSTWFRKEGS
jgi:hypothetical protein